MQEAELQAVVRGAIAQANGKVLDQIDQHGEMGATLVAAVIYGQTAYHGQHRRQPRLLYLPPRAPSPRLPAISR